MNIYYNSFETTINIPNDMCIGEVQELILNRCMLFVYEIEHIEIINNNKKYIFGSENIPFTEKYNDFLEKNNINIEDKINCYIIDRKKDENGNVFKNNVFIENYIKWYNDYIEKIQETNEKTNEENVLYNPLQNILDSIFRYPLFEPSTESIIIQENEQTLEETKEPIEEMKINEPLDEIESINRRVDSAISFLNQYIENIGVTNIATPIISTTIIYNDYIDIDISNNFLFNEYEDVKIILEDEKFEELEKIEYDENITQKECLICLETFNENEKLIKIKCNHIFHIDCIKKWVCYESNKCPVCRIDVNDGIKK